RHAWIGEIDLASRNAVFDGLWQRRGIHFQTHAKSRGGTHTVESEVCLDAAESGALDGAMQADGAEEALAAERVVAERIAPAVHQVGGVVADQVVAGVGAWGLTAEAVQGERRAADEQPGETTSERRE